MSYNYNRLWETMEKKNVTQYQLIKEYGFSQGVLDNLRKNKNITVNTVDFLCQVLDCTPNDIIEIIKDEDFNAKYKK